MITGGYDTDLLIIFLHLGLVLDAGHVLHLEATGDVEVGTQLGVLFQPVFVVGLQPVDAAVLVDEEGNSAVDFVIVFQTANLVVLVQAVLQIGVQLIIRLIADTQHVHAVVLQLLAELPVVCREIGGNKNDVLHNRFQLSLFF